MRTLLVAAAVVLLFVCPLTLDAAMTHSTDSAVASSLPTQMASAKVGTEAAREAARLDMIALHGRLMAQRVELGDHSPLQVELSPEEAQKLAEPSPAARLRVGLVTDLGASIDLDEMLRLEITDKASPRRIGAVRRVGSSMVWTTSIVAPGANGMRLYITGLDLPKGVELAIYNQRGEAFAYTGQGPTGLGSFWTNTISGSTASMQLSGADISGVSFKISQVGYLGERFVYGAGSNPAKSFCSYNESCVENAGCGIDQAAADATNGVAYMLFHDNRYMYACSGGLINNASGKDYFLTANHCMSKDRAAGTLEAYFFYQIGCHDSCPAEWSSPTTPRTLGSSVAATNKTGDYTILELDQSAPAGTVRLGWNATDIAFDNGVQLYRISHPSTAPQAYSTHTVDTSYGTCVSWPRGSWIYSHDTYGATEGGSSGSPVLNSAGQIVGQLSGGCGTNINDVCDSSSNATVDGAFASYYSSVAGLLN